MSSASLKSIEERIAFIGGLHRSGTTPLARWLGAHPEISGLSGTGAYEDEGQHLQSVYPTAIAHGGPGRFAFDPDARLTENSPRVTADAAGRLVSAWAPYWDTSKSVLLEKSPPNLIRMRYLHALFPAARFIVVIRHPIAVSLATQKWSRTSMDSLLRHWLAGHSHLVADAQHVRRVTVIRYEDLMANPERHLAHLFSLLGLAPHVIAPSVRGGLNDSYFRQFRADLQPWRKPLHARIARRYEQDVAPFGYSLLEPTRLSFPPGPVGAIAIGAPRSAVT